MAQVCDISVQHEIDSAVSGSSKTSTAKDVYVCSVCHKVLSSPASLKRHMLTHDLLYSRPKPVLKHSCGICGKSFHTPSNVRRHMSVHTGEKKFKCQYCSQRFTQKEHYQTHLLSAHTAGAKTYKCTFPGCSSDFVVQSLLVLHMKRHSKWGTWTCQQCDKIVTNKSQLNQHMLEHADPSQTSKCDVCGVLFKSAGKLKEHKKIHTPEIVNTCQVCGATFRSVSGFRMHAEKKCGLSAYKYRCNKCEKCFLKKASLISHERRHTPGTRVIRKKNTTSRYRCRVCLETFSGFKQFEMHAEQECGRKAYPYTCNKCSSSFLTANSLKIHKRAHKKGIYGLKCGTCGNTYRRLIGLQKHVLNTGHEVADARFKCKVCGKKFPSSAELETHAATHTSQESLPQPPQQTEPDPQLTCKKCLRRFPDKAELLSHISTKHGFAFLCYVCGERFKKQEEVNSHMKVQHNE